MNDDSYVAGFSYAHQWIIDYLTVELDQFLDDNVRRYIENLLDNIENYLDEGIL